MDKQKQIEEMAYKLTQYEYKLCEKLPKNECLLTSKIHSQVSCDYCKIAEYLINAGYRKIPENAVVLTDEEYERWQGQTLNIKKVRKEMAEKFKEMARSAFFGINCATFDEWDWFYNKLGEIAKELINNKSCEI